MDIDQSNNKEINDSHSRENNYFTCYEDLDVHRLMLNDAARTEAYKQAIFENAHLFKDKLVMDVGAGTGILSLFMAKAGAKKVYAIEASSLAQKIPQIAKDNGFSKQIVVFHTKIEDFALPRGEKVEVIVSEWMGFYLFHESMFSSVLYARDHFLSDDGTFFPSEARLYACPCSLESLYREYFYFWHNVHGFDLSALSETAITSKQIKPEIREIKPSDLLSDPVCIRKFNLRYVSEAEVSNFSCTNFTGITKAGLNQGLAVWFECDFEGRDYDEEGREFGSLVQLKTSPLDPSTHWKQTLIIYGPLKPPRICSSDSHSATPERKSDEQITRREQEDAEYEVEPDEVVGWRLNFSKSAENHRHYNITFEMLDPELETHPTPCLCPTPKCMIIAKMLENEGEIL